MSSEQRVSKATEDVAALLDHFERELKKDRQSRLIFLIVSVIAVGVVFGYMWWLHRIVKETITPRNVAEVVEAQARHLIPKATAELSRVLRQSAPDVAVALKDRFLQDVLPELRSVGEQELLSLASESVKVAENEMAKTVEAVIRQGKAEIRAEAESEASTGPNQLAQRLAQVVEIEMKRRATERPEEPLYIQLEQSKRQLQLINKKLRALASKKKDLTRTEALEKRLIQSWMGFVDQRARVQVKPR